MPEPVIYVCNDCGQIATPSGEMLKPGKQHEHCRSGAHNWQRTEAPDRRLTKVAIDSLKEFFDTTTKVK